MLTLFIWDLLDPKNEILARLTGVLAILLGAVSIAVPILQRMSRREERLMERTSAAGTVRHCVVCGHGLNDAHHVDILCPECGAHFNVEFLHGHA